MKILTHALLCLLLFFGTEAVLAQSPEVDSQDTTANEMTSGKTEKSSYDSNHTVGWNRDSGLNINVNRDDSEFVPALAIFSFFGAPIAITAIVVLAWNYRQKRRLSLMEKIVESGQPIPEALLTNEMDQGAPGSSLKKGLVSLGVGIGIVIFGTTLNTIVMAVGAIPICMGLAYLLLWKLEDKPEQENSDSL